MMMNLADAVKFFGCSPQNPELDTYLTGLGITERPRFEENPADDIRRHEDGYSFSFRALSGYKKNWGLPRDELGDMIFYVVEVYGPINDSDCNAYQGALPYNLSFSSTLADAKRILGEPTISHPSGPENEVFVWYNLSGFTLGLCMLPNGKGISFLSMEKAQKNPPIPF